VFNGQVQFFPPFTRNNRRRALPPEIESAGDLFFDVTTDPTKIEVLPWFRETIASVKTDPTGTAAGSVPFCSASNFSTRWRPLGRD
jgi:hypothetical protein